MKKVFVVGCPRSGTSVVQKVVAENFNLWTMPETGFFTKDLKSFKGRVSAITSLYRQEKVKGRFNDYFDAFSALIYFSVLFRGGVKAVFYEKFAVEFFDRSMRRLTKKNGKHGWLEKTPTHYRNLNEILTFFPDAVVLFVVRDGMDVCASIYDRFLKYKDYFPEEGSPYYGVSLWNESLGFCEEVLMFDAVKLISFEDFVEHEIAFRSWVSSVIGVKEQESKVPASIETPHEKWKESVHADVGQPENKISRLFSSEEVVGIKSSLDYKKYNILMSARSFLQE